MAKAIFGIGGDSLNMVANPLTALPQGAFLSPSSSSTVNFIVSLLVLGLIIVWLALIVYTYLDAKRRISDPFLVGCATIASFIPYLGTIVYAIVRPPEYLEDAHERELEIRAAELRVRQLRELTCPACSYPIEKSFLRCPRCQRRLKDPCPSCGKPVDPRWALCPFCETVLSERQRQRPQRSSEGRRGRQSGAADEPPPVGRGGRRSAPPPAGLGGSPIEDTTNADVAERREGREPNPDPRQA